MKFKRSVIVALGLVLFCQGCSPRKPRANPFAFLEKMNAVAAEIAEELAKRLPDRGYPAPEVSAVMGGLPFPEKMEAGAKLEPELLSEAERFSFFVTYVHEDDFPIFNEVAAKVLVRHGIDRIKVVPFQNYIDTERGRIEQPKWNMIGPNAKFVLEADEMGRPVVSRDRTSPR